MITADAIPGYAAGTWKLDPTHSEISFSVKHLMISKVRGTFRTFDVTVVTGDDPQATSVEASIDVASVDTNNEMRDQHLRTSDFFKADEFPKATFTSTSLTGTPDDFVLAGDLTLRGVTKPVQLKGELGGIIVDGYGQTKAAASATAKINRLDFGVNWNAPLEAGGVTLGDEITLTFDLQLVLQQG